MEVLRPVNPHKDYSPHLSTWHTKLDMTDVVVNCIRNEMNIGNELHKDYAEMMVLVRVQETWLGTSTLLMSTIEYLLTPSTFQYHSEEHIGCNRYILIICYRVRTWELWISFMDGSKAITDTIHRNKILTFQKPPEKPKQDYESLKKNTALVSQLFLSIQSRCDANIMKTKQIMITNRNHPLWPIKLDICELEPNRTC